MLTAIEINDLWNQSKNPDDFARAIERSVLAKAMPIPKQETIYMWRLEDDGWMECTKEFFEADISSGYEKRIVYAEPQPAQAAAIPEWTDEQCAQFVGVAMRHVDIVGGFTWDDIRLGCTFANRLSASPKP